MQEKAYKNSGNKGKWMFVGLAWELGYLIAIPAVVGILCGRYLDQRFDSSPLFILVGVTISLGITLFGVARKIKNLAVVIEEADRKEIKEQE